MKKYTDQEYKELTEKVISFAEQLWKAVGYPDVEPLDTPPALRNAEKSREEYCDYVFEDWKNSGYKSTSGYEVLPLWYAMPYMHMYSIGWRMGGGEEYAMIFWAYYDSLSEEEQKKYQEKYPAPPHFVDELSPTYYDFDEDAL